MRRRSTDQAELQPVYVRPVLDRLQRAAARDYRRAAYRGDRNKPKRGDFDPLWLRLGLRVCMIENRAGWVVSNPLYDQSLRANPRNDPSLPGPGWLREVYRWKTRELVALPGVLVVIEARLQVLRELEQSNAAKTAETFQAAPATGAGMRQVELF